MITRKAQNTQYGINIKTEVVYNEGINIYSGI